MKVIIPLKEVLNLSDEGSSGSKSDALCVEIKSGKVITSRSCHINPFKWTFLLPQNFEDRNICKNVWHVARSKKDSVSTCLLDFFETSKEAPFYDEEQQTQKQLWDKYFSKYGQAGISMIKDTTALKELFEEGIPEHLRGKL